MRRRFSLLSAVGLLCALATAPSALAQGTVIQAAPQTVSTGTLVTVTGGSFNNTSPDVGPVNIRLSTRSGQILLGGANLNSRGQLENATFLMPAVAPGNYLLLATQVYANGRQVAFTPGRTRIRVVAASAAVAGTGSASSPLPWIAGGFAVVLLMAGLALTAHRLWPRTRPSLGN